jgi:PAS domain S-box-containing protein
MLPQTEPFGQAGSFYQTDNQLRRLFVQAPGLIAILRWREGIIELHNPLFSQLWGNRELLNKPMRQALPELEGNGFFEKVESVFDTGKPFFDYERPAKVDWNNDGNLTEAYFDTVYSPSYNQAGEVDGVLFMGHDVTEKVMARKHIAEQHQMFKDLADAAGTALWTVDLRGEITYVNQTWINWTGRPYEAHLGRGWAEFVMPEDRDRVISGYIRDYYRKTEYDTDFRLVRSDGKIQWVAVNGKPRYLPNGEFAGYVGSCMDITERKISEQQLMDSEERFRTIADSAPVLIWMTGIHKTTTFLNKGWDQFHGNEDLADTSEYLQAHLIHEQDVERVLNSYHQAFNNQGEFYQEYRMRHKDGSFRWIAMKGVPNVTHDGTFQGYIGSGMDITEMKEHEQVKDDFIGMASHELKTPITSIKAYIQLLLTIYKNKEEDAFLMKSLTTVNNQINKLIRLITDLLDVSKMESGRLSLNSEQFIMNDLVKETVEEVQHASTSHDIVYVATANCTIKADRDRIAQVVTNFLTNAIKYSPESDRVDIRLSREGDHVVVAVQDYGIGISPDDQKKVFNRFYRVEGRNEQTFSGFGIGLYVAAEIVRRHSGSVWIESEKDKGSTFYFTLPINFC